MLKELQKYKMLLGSLPQAQAPAHLFENVRASLERSVLLDEYHGKARAKAGAVHLFARRMVAAAAMIALVGVLGFVIYNIVKPEAKPPVDVAKMFPAAVRSRDRAGKDGTCSCRPIRRRPSMRLFIEI